MILISNRGRSGIANHRHPVAGDPEPGPLAPVAEQGTRHAIGVGEDRAAGLVALRAPVQIVRSELSIASLVGVVLVAPVDGGPDDHPGDGIEDEVVPVRALTWAQGAEGGAHAFRLASGDELPEQGGDDVANFVCHGSRHTGASRDVGAGDLGKLYIAIDQPWRQPRECAHHVAGASREGRRAFEPVEQVCRKPGPSLTPAQSDAGEGERPGVEQPGGGRCFWTTLGGRGRLWGQSRVRE